MTGVLTESTPNLLLETVDTEGGVTPVTGNTDTKVTDGVRVQSFEISCSGGRESLDLVVVRGRLGTTNVGFLVPPVPTGYVPVPVFVKNYVIRRYIYM